MVTVRIESQASWTGPDVYLLLTYRTSCSVRLLQLEGSYILESIKSQTLHHQPGQTLGVCNKAPPSISWTPSYSITLIMSLQAVDCWLLSSQTPVAGRPRQPMEIGLIVNNPSVFVRRHILSILKPFVAIITFTNPRSYSEHLLPVFDVVPTPVIEPPLFQLQCYHSWTLPLVELSMMTTTMTSYRLLLVSDQMRMGKRDQLVRMNPPHPVRGERRNQLEFHHLHCYYHYSPPQYHSPHYHQTYP